MSFIVTTQKTTRKKIKYQALLLTFKNVAHDLEARSR